MHVKQLNVFIENKPGRLEQFTRLLARQHIDLISLSLADSDTFGMLRGLVKDAEEAVRVILEAGYTANVTEVIAVEVPDRAGGLAEVLETLSAGGINIEYLYSFMRNSGGRALIILRTKQMEEAAAELHRSGVRMLSQEEICSL